MAFSVPNFQNKKKDNQISEPNDHHSHILTSLSIQNMIGGCSVCESH